MSSEPMSSEALAPPATPIAADPPATPIAADTPATSPATSVAAPAAAAPAAPAAPTTPATTSGAQATSGPRRRVVVLAGVRRVLGFAFSVGLLVGGVALGYNAFVTSQPSAAPVVDPATNGVEAPPAVVELTAALASNDADKVRAAVQGEPYKLLTSEMQRWNFRDVATVETLSTVVDGDRSATVLVIVGNATDGTPVTVNLIVQTQDGAIVNFR